MVGLWAEPGGTAIPGQPVGETKQALISTPAAKIHLIRRAGTLACVPGIKLRRTDTTLDLSS